MTRAASNDIHLSVVATSRNDNHGGYLTHRMQHFVDGLVAQCRRHDLRAELVLVEWNPPADRRPLIEELRWPSDLGPCEIRIITVPGEVHARIEHGDKLPLFQMIAKNVGIRRARGRFVLATNIDILFSDEAICFIRDRLRPGCLYRADRCDVPTEVPDGVPFDKVLDFCRKEMFRIHATGFTLVRQMDGSWKPSSSLAAILGVIWSAVKKSARSILAAVSERLRLALLAALGFLRFALGGGLMHSRAHRRAEIGILRRIIRRSRADLARAKRFVVVQYRSVEKVVQWIHHALIKRELFTNACGDFTLLSKEDWASFRGYPEWPMYSWHLDSLLLYQSNRSALQEVYLGREAAIYHIEHEPGSGFTPESSDKLFARLAARGIPYLDWETDVLPMIEQMDRDRSAGVKVVYNDLNWGLASHEFPDVYAGRETLELVR